MKKGKKAKRNPWRANSLEWQAPSPPPHGNFDIPIHVYRGPYEFSSPESVQDFLPQTVSPEELAEQVQRHKERMEQEKSEFELS
jgi:cytochrome c oxidase subunit I